MNLAGPLTSIASYAHRLMVDADVWREETVATAGGGIETTWVDQQRTVKVQLVSPTPEERQTAAQQGVEVTHSATFPIDADVQRHDRLIIGSDDPYQLESDPQIATHSAVARAQVKQTPWE